MPSSPLDFRTQQNYHAQKAVEAMKDLYTRPPAEMPPPERSFFRENYSYGANSTAELGFQPPPFVMQQNALATSMQLLMLLSQVRPAETALYLNHDNALLPVENRQQLTPETPHMVLKKDPPAAASGAFLLPSAAAMPVIPAEKGVVWNSATNSLSLTSEEKKKDFFAELKDYFVANGQLTANEGEDFELNMRSAAAGHPVFIYSMEEPAAKSTDATLTRNKRFILEQQDADIAEHIKQHCAFEEEVLDTEGKNRGKVLIFQAQRADKPFRWIYDNKPNGKPSPEERGAADGLNITFAVLTVGLLPLISGLVASTKRHSYYQQQGDDICAKRYEHLILANILTAVDAGSLEYQASAETRPGMLTSLAHAQTPEERAAYYTRDPHTNIRTELLLQLKDGKRGINDGSRIVYLKPTEKEDEFVTWYPRAAYPQKLERKVIIDKGTMTWRYADTFDTSSIDVEMMEGKSYINLYGDYYQILKNSKDKYEIVLKTESGAKEYLGVYMEPLTRDWHLSTHFARPAFSPAQEKIVNRLQVEINHEYSYVQESNNNPKYYGRAKTWHSEKIGDDSHYELGRYIEMNGKLIPVRQKVVPAHGVRYEIYDINKPNAKAWQVEWDGNRWLFESTTSAQIKPDIQKRITPEMFIPDIDVKTLSAPDSQGIRWNASGQRFIKIDDKYIRIRELNFNRYSFESPIKENSFITVFADNEYHLEKLGERLKNIITRGMGGIKRTHPVDTLKEIDGFNEEKARELLGKYRFQKNSVYSADTFVMEIEQTGEIPPWSERFKIPRPAAQTSDTLETVRVIDSRFPELKLELKLGKQLEGENNKNVYLDADDNTFIIKKYIYDGSTAPVTQAIKEAEQFVRYNGQGAAKLFHDSDKNSYLRMYHLPGEPLDSLSAGTLSANAGEKFVNMFEKASLAGIKPEDFRAQNIVWDEKVKDFHLINSPHGKSVDTAVAGDDAAYWDDVLVTLEELVAAQNVAAPPVVGKAEQINQEAEELARHKHGVPPAEPQQAPAETAAHAGQRADTDSKDAGKISANTAGKAAENTGARADIASLNFADQVAAMDMKNAPLDRLFLSTAPKYAKVSGKLDEIIYNILANKDTSLNGLQKLRLQSLKKAIKSAIDKGSDTPELEKFIDNNRAEVLHPGYARSLPHQKNNDYKTVERNLWLFNVRTSKGGAEAETLLYPEDGLIELQQVELDATKYEKAVSKLTDAEKKALRTWTGLPEEAGKIYSDNSIATGLEISFELNSFLRDEKPLDAQLQTLYDDISSAIAPGKLPTQKGEYIRTASYNFIIHDPWTAQTIKVGDVVSNGRQFMSVSSDTEFADTYALKGDNDVKSIVNYKIDSRQGPAPLLPNALSLSTFENEYLFRPNSYFKVKEISVMEPLPAMSIDGSNTDVKIPLRAGVVLEEVDLPAGSEQTVKDIFSGKSWTVNTPETNIPAEKNPQSKPGNSQQS